MSAVHQKTENALRHTENTCLLYQQSASRPSVWRLVETGRAADWSNEANPTTTTDDVHRRTLWTANHDWTRYVAVARSSPAQRTKRTSSNQSIC